jgi:hypothetical protein
MRQVDFDIVSGSSPQEFDVATDNWTLHFEPGGSFLAIDSEPDHPSEYEKARREVMSEEVERALAAADRELAGALTAELERSGDPFTNDFVTALREPALV